MPDLAAQADGAEDRLRLVGRDSPLAAPESWVETRTGLRVPRLCIGVVSDAATVTHAYANGCRFFFISSDLHFAAYDCTAAGIRRLLADGVDRSTFVIGVCSYVTQPEFIAVSLAEGAARLGDAGADLLIAGGCYAADTLPRTQILSELVANGFLNSRGVGATFHDRVAARTAVTRGLVDVAFARYNAGHTGALVDLFPAIADESVPLFNFTSTRGYVPHRDLPELGVGEGWQPTRADHYRFVLSRPEIAGILCAPRTPAELDALLAAWRAGPLSADEQAYLVTLHRAASRTRMSRSSP